MNVRNIASDDSKKLFSSLLLTCKNVSLYPEGHSISTNSIRQFHETLVSFIRQYGDTRIEIEKDRVICQGIEVHKGTSEEGTLPFTLFRDGIRWMEFNEGISLEETQDVLSIIHRYSVLTAEPEGDIVTAFWEAHFDHVSYLADDFAEQGADQMESTSQPDEDEMEPEGKEEPPDEAAISATTSGTLVIDPASFVLTPEEQIELQTMVTREERASAREHLNMLLDMLLQIQEEKDFKIVLSVLAEEFEGSFSSHDYEIALIILDGMRKVLDSERLRTAWSAPLIESFYKDISSAAHCLKPLEDAWSHLNAQQIETIKGIFKHLKPEAVNTLVRLLLLGQPSELEKIVEYAVTSLVSKDINSLEPLINDPDERIAEKIIPVLSTVDGEAALKYLKKLARHPSSAVRRNAIKALGQIHGHQTVTIFEFIDDPDMSVRRTILAQMSQSRNETAEDLLIKHIQGQLSGPANNDYILECFRTLGRCGSVRSIPFLRETLMHRKWLAVFKKSVYREGAAQALVALRLPEARQIIEAAGRSFYPGLRRIARDAEKELFQKNKGGK